LVPEKETREDFGHDRGEYAALVGGGILEMVDAGGCGNMPTGVVVEKEAGTTDLERLGGVGMKMPVTFICFFITAAAISGVPPLNGFFSKELVYDAAIERGAIFYLAAVVGSFFTAASFLKLGHAAFLGRLSEKNKDIKEVPARMLFPMIVIAAVCIIFGIYNAVPLDKLIQPILPKEMLGDKHSFAGFPTGMAMVKVSLAVLVAAILNHIYGVLRTGSGLRAVDHIHHAPVLSWIYDRAEKGWFDPYNIGMAGAKAFARFSSWLDKTIDYIYNELIPRVSDDIAVFIKRLHTGSYRLYLVWSVAGVLAAAIFLIMSGQGMGAR